MHLPLRPGATLKPLRALLTAALISTSAAVFEELAFRGVLQTLLQLGLGLVLPAQVAIALAVSAQALLFGVLHSYTPSPAYLISATIAGASLGGAFAATGNLFVPMLMHFVLDFVSFTVCHVQIALSGEPAQRRLMGSETPIASALAASMSNPVFGK